MRGAERRALWLMCPIKLLQTLWRQLLPAGPWVQIGSVSLPRVVSAGPESGGQLSGTRPAFSPLLNLGPLQPPPPPRLRSLQYPSGLPGPARLLTVLTPACSSPRAPPSPHALSPVMGVSCSVGGPVSGSPSQVTQQNVFPPLITRAP